MLALRHKNGQLPRGYADHRTSEGRLYTSYLRAILDRLGPLPKSADPTLRDVGRLVVELEGMGLELAAAKSSPKRRMDVNRLRRQMVAMQKNLLKLELRLEDLASKDTQVSSLTEYIRAKRAGE